MIESKLEEGTSQQSSHGAGQVNNYLSRSGKDRDFLYRAEGKSAFGGEYFRMEWDRKASGVRVTAINDGAFPTACYTSPVIRCRFPATEFLPSWNIRLFHLDQGFRILLRVYGEDLHKHSPWFMLGESGAPINSPPPADSPWGKTHIDYLEAVQPAWGFQYKVEFVTSAPENPDTPLPLIKRFFVHYSGQGTRRHRVLAPNPAAPKDHHIPIPYRSQLAVDRESLRNHICCPTSLAMVLESYGINRPTLEICDAVYNERYDMYGIWPQLSHVAFQHGFASWVTRFRSHAQVREHLLTGNPIIASIRVENGELRGARYPQSNGHIIVLVGYRSEDTYIVNDPFSTGPEGAEIDYFAEDIEKVWLDKGGVAILVEKEK